MSENIEVDQLDQQLKENLDKIRNTIVVISGKGGVGKSTVASNLALALAKDHKIQVGLLDADIDGPNIPKMLGIENDQITGLNGNFVPVEFRKNLHVISMAFFLESRDSPVIWRGPLKAVALKQFLGQVSWGVLDYLIVDLPPGTGDAPLSAAQIIKGIVGAIVVTTPQDVALLDSRKAVNFAKALGVPIIGILENMSGFTCPHCGKTVDLFKIGGGEEASKEMNVPFLGRIPFDPRVVETGDSGVPFVESFPDSPSSKAFMEIVIKCEVFFQGFNNKAPWNK